MILIWGYSLCSRTSQRDFIEDRLTSRPEARGGGKDGGRETQKGDEGGLESSSECWTPSGTVSQRLGILQRYFCYRRLCPRQRGRVRNTLASPFPPSSSSPIPPISRIQAKPPDMGVRNHSQQEPAPTA